MMNKDLKKYALRLLQFLPVCAVGYIILVCLWAEMAPKVFHKNMFTHTADYDHTYRRLQEVDSVRNVDILIIGSSHAYRGFDTRIFKKAGYESFNLGSSSQTPIQTKMLLKRYLPVLNPNQVVFEVYPGTFELDGIKAGMVLLGNDQNDWASIEMAWRSKHLKTFNTMIFGFYRNWVHSEEIFHQPDKLREDLYIPGGFVERDMETFAYKDHQLSKWDLRQDQLDAFYSIVAMLEERNISLVLVQAPITESRYSSHSNNREFDQMMSEVGNYYNFNEMDLSLDDSLHFYDGHHLNQRGVEVFNEKMLEVIN